MSDFDTPDPVEPVAALPDPNTDDAWQSDGDGKLDANALPDPGEPPAATAPPIETSQPDDAPAAKLADRERNPDGTLKPKTGKRRDDPYVAVKEATGKAARAREDADTARREAEDARREAADLRAKLAARERPAEPSSETPASKLPPGYPSINDIGTKYADWDDYEAAKEDWRAAEVAKARAVEAEQREDQTFRARFTEASQSVPQWAESVTAADNAILAAGFRTPDGCANWPISLFKAVMGSSQMPEIVQFLGSHPEECTQWARDCASANPPAATVVRRLLERQVSLSAAALPDSARQGRPSTAKPPVNRVGSSATATPLDPDDLPFGPDYIKAENERERKAREARRAW